MSDQDLLRELYEHIKWRDIPIDLLERFAKYIERQGPTAEGADWVPVPREPTEAMVTAGWDAAGHAYPSDRTLVVTWKAMLSAAPRPDAGEGLVEKLRELLARFEWDDDLDETACPTNWVTCRVCDGGGTWDKRKKRPPTHMPDCQLAAALEAARALGREEKA